MIDSRIGAGPRSRTALQKGIGITVNRRIVLSRKEVFTNIYNTDYWVKGSGVGSFPEHTQKYRQFLQSFLKEKNIKTVVDFGCGDWQFSQFIDWQGVHYQGFDLVESVVQENQKKFAQENIEFHTLDDRGFESLPEADLVIVKDVLQHWPNQEILAFLPTLKKFKYALITNAYKPSRKVNRDIPMGECRPVDLSKAPFHLKSKKVLKFGPSKQWYEVFKKTWSKRTDLFS